jgi:hypothetical protein
MHAARPVTGASRRWPDMTESIPRRPLMECRTEHGQAIADRRGVQPRPSHARQPAIYLGDTESGEGRLRNLALPDESDTAGLITQADRRVRTSLRSSQASRASAAVRPPAPHCGAGFETGRFSQIFSFAAPYGDRRLGGTTHGITTGEDPNLPDTWAATLSGARLRPTIRKTRLIGRKHPSSTT